MKISLSVITLFILTLCFFLQGLNFFINGEKMWGFFIGVILAGGSFFYAIYCAINNAKEKEEEEKENCEKAGEFKK